MKHESEKSIKELCKPLSAKVMPKSLEHMSEKAAIAYQRGQFKRGHDGKRRDGPK